MIHHRFGFAAEPLSLLTAAASYAGGTARSGVRNSEVALRRAKSCDKAPHSKAYSAELHGTAQSKIENPKSLDRPFAGRRILDVLRHAGCRRVYLDGNFVSTKAIPGDYDVAWEPTGVDVRLLLGLDPVFGIFDAERAAQKAKYGGEFFPSSANEALSGRTFLDFFQTDKDSGGEKGIVALDLGESSND